MQAFRIVEIVTEFRSPSFRLDAENPLRSVATVLAKTQDGEEVALEIEGHVLATIRLHLNSIAQSFPAVMGVTRN